jgi:hypothetical protein
MKTVGFSIDLHDVDGDISESGLYIHIDDAVILRFETLSELKDFRNSLTTCIEEIIENYPEEID